LFVLKLNVIRFDGTNVNPIFIISWEENLLRYIILCFFQYVKN